MEPDRFQHNQQNYIIGIICLVISLSLFAFCAYLLPYLIFNWHYALPDFIMEWMNSIQYDYKFSATATSWIIFSIIFVPAVIFAIIADILSNQIDNQIHGIEPAPPNKQVKREIKESSNLVLRIIGIIVLVFIAAQLFQWAISTPSP